MLGLAKAQNSGKSRKRPTDEEHRIQCACVRWFRYRFPTMHHNLIAVPNGGRRDKVTGARLKAEGVLEGVSDLILLKCSSGYGALMIEMKTEKGRQSDSQVQWQRNISNDGYKYVVCRSLDDFMREVCAYLEQCNEMDESKP